MWNGWESYCCFLSWLRLEFGARNRNYFKHLRFQTVQALKISTAILLKQHTKAISIIMFKVECCLCHFYFQVSDCCAEGFLLKLVFLFVMQKLVQGTYKNSWKWHQNSNKTHASLFYIWRTQGGLGVACWPLVPKFAGSNPAEAVGFLRAKKSSARLPSEGK